MEKQDKSLQEKAIKIKGKDYVLVSDRVLFFNEEYPNGSIETERVSCDNNVEVFKAIITPDITVPERFFTGRSQAKRGEGYINETSALENAETSAVGRALAMMWIGVIDSIASVDEIDKAENTAKVQQKKVVTASSNDLPWFNKEELELLRSNAPWIQEHSTREELIRDIRTKYRVSKEMDWKITQLWNEIALSDNLPF